MDTINLLIILLMVNQLVHFVTLMVAIHSLENKIERIKEKKNDIYNARDSK